MKPEIQTSLLNTVAGIESKFGLLISSGDLEKILSLAYDDLQAFSNRDPSSKNDMNYILNTYLSYRAVLYYRIAHSIYLNGNYKIARRISEYAKLKTGIEIHPACNIGKRFVLDHGVGTVIGETTIIGDDCYFLQNIILGARQIANNKSQRRHPIIGNNVEIGGFVKIYGNVRIGNNVVISPGAVIKADIEDNSKVVVSTEYQVQKGESKILFTGYNERDNHITIFFKNFDTIDKNGIEVFNNNTPIKVAINNNAIEFEKPQNKGNTYKFVFGKDEIIDVKIQ